MLFRRFSGSPRLIYVHCITTEIIYIYTPMFIAPLFTIILSVHVKIWFGLEGQYYDFFQGFPQTPDHCKLWGEK